MYSKGLISAPTYYLSKCPNRMEKVCLKILSYEDNIKLAITMLDKRTNDPNLVPTYDFTIENLKKFGIEYNKPKKYKRWV